MAVQGMCSFGTRSVDYGRTTRLSPAIVAAMSMSLTAAHPRGSGTTATLKRRTYAGGESTNR